jgi:predicted membrane-bound mannosyltransferase
LEAVSLSSDDTSSVATASGSEWPITPQFGREPGPSWRRVLPLVVVVAPFAVFAAAYVLVTPLGQGPDELSHLGYIHGIVSPGVLPTAATPEKQQPPLYYLMGAVLYMLTHDDRLVRLLSVVLGIAALGVSWLVVRRLLPGRPWLAALAVALMAFLPEAQYVSGVVDDDSLAWLSGTLVILLLVVVLQSERVSLRLALGAGAVVGVALVSKETVWLAALILAALVAVRCLRQGAPGRLWALALPAAAISGWWFVRNVVTFHSLLPPLAPLGSHNQYLDSLLAARDWVSLTRLSRAQGVVATVPAWTEIM